MTGRFSCARASLARDEPLYATASTVSRWITIEQPGPWGRDALLESRLPGTTGEEIEDRARELRARVILIRRYRGRDDEPDVHRVYVAHTGRPAVWLESFRVQQPAGVLDLDLDPLRSGRPVGGEPVTHPLYLTCTNGSHDVCCAEFGRPVAAAMDRARPAAAWECSHIGGDRFAGNLLILPEGLYYGRVGPDDAARIADRHERGLLDLDHYRGRSSYPFVVQAAEHFLRRERGHDGIDDVHPVARLESEDGSQRVVFRLPGGARVAVVLTVRPDPDGHLLTCRSDGPACPPRYAVRRIEPIPSEPASGVGSAPRPPAPGGSGRSEAAGG